MPTVCEYLTGKHSSSSNDQQRSDGKVYSYRTAGGHGNGHYIISSTAVTMAYTVPADPGWDLNALLDKVPELAKKAIAGGLFLGLQAL